MSISDIHKFRGRHVSYALRCQGDIPRIYVGSTSDIEQRFVDHGQGRAAKFTKAHPPTGEILHIKEHETVREALLCELGLWSLFAGK